MAHDRRVVTEHESRAAAFATTLGRVARLGQGYTLAVSPDGAGWVDADRVNHEGPEFRAVIDRLGVRGAPPAARRALGSQFVLAYLRFLWPTVAAFALDRRVPDVAAGNMLVRFSAAGVPDEFGLREPRFGTLEDDAFAGLACHRAESSDGLLAWLQDRVDAHVQPLFEAVQAACGTSPSALWGNLAVGFALPLLWHLQHVMPDDSTVVRDARALLSGFRSTPMNGRVELLTVAHPHGEAVVHARRTCCLRWSVPGESRCDDCPLNRGPDAADFLRERVADAVARGHELRVVLGRPPDVAGGAS